MNRNKKMAEYRAELKKLEEQRAEMFEEMQGIVTGAKAEERAMSEDEEKKFTELEGKIQAIDRTIEAEKRAQKLVVESSKAKKNDEAGKDEDVVKAEERAFANFLRDNIEELRAGGVQLTQGLNGTIVPTTIANRIIKAVRDMVPFLTMADVVYTNGKLSVPVYGEDATNYIDASYVDEGQELTDNIGKFTTIDLTGYVIGALSLVSNKLVSNVDFDIVSFVVNQVAEAIAIKLEREFVLGTESKITGIITADARVKAAASSAITYDELVGLKHSIKQRFQKNAVWIMNNETYTAICKLKDDMGRPYFADDDYKVLNRPVIISDSMPDMATGNKAIVFGDLKGYTIKATKTVEISVLREKFATKNMLGVLAFGEYDGKIVDAKRFAALQMA